MPKHAEIRMLPYSADQIYALVADVARYPEFLPWTSATRIRARSKRPDGAEVIDVDMVISFKVFRERFGSRVTLWPETHRIDTEYIDGPFRYMRSHWAIADRPGGGSDVSFHVDFEFRNAILQALIGVVFDEAIRRIVRSFEKRAVALYGPMPGLT